MLCGLKSYGCRVILGDDARSRADWFPREFEVISGVRLEQLKRLHGPQEEPPPRSFMRPQASAL
jgi:hypothetical protein